jgi:septation ring formation regulator EzrA
MTEYTFEQTEKMLNALSDLQCQREVIDLDKQKMIDSVLTPEIRKQIADIEVEFACLYPAVDEKITALTTQVKEAVISQGETVNGEHLQAVFMKGRTSWNTEKLDGMMALIPQLVEARKTGDPSVSIRRRG